MPTKKNAVSSRMNRKFWLRAGIGSVALLLLAAVGWLVWSMLPDREVEAAKELFTQVRNPEISAEERDRLRTELRAMTENLNEGQREQVFREFGQSMRRQFTERIDKYFELPEDQRVAYLDEQIREMEKWRQAREANRGEGGNGRGGQAGGPGRGGPGGPPGGDRRGNRGDDGSGMSGRRRMLDRTSAEERAKFTEYMQAMQERREQLGLPPMRFGPPRGGRGGGGGGRSS